MLVLVAVTLPVIVMLASFVIDVGNWYEHKRHLQLQVDSAALAGGGLYAAMPCSNTNISAEARKYAGPAATGGGTYNAQVGNTPSREPARPDQLDQLLQPGRIRQQRGDAL